MTYLLAALAGTFGLVLLVLLGVQQLSVFVQMWQRRPDFDPTTVLRAARVAGLMILGATTVVAGLVVHWRFVHGRLDWDWGLILAHVDGPDGELVEEPEPTAGPSEFCLERCTAFCLGESDD